jgi:rfaE bifunctional protein kinase chain/domain
MHNIVDEFKKLNILVIGDVMLDRFIWGDVERISPEAPVPVVRVVSETATLGGAANVLNNIISLGAKGLLCGVIGDDIFSRTITSIFKEKDISLKGIIQEKDRPTIVKTRVIGQKQQIVRVDREEVKPLKPKTINRLLEFVEQNISDFDAVILSDYGKGVINSKFYKKLVSLVKSHNKIINIDPKNSNMHIYKQATLLTPNLNEASSAANERITLKNIGRTGKKLLKKFQSEYLVITLGDKGMAIFINNNGDYIHIPTVAKEVFDVTGAGDTVISVLTMAMALGLNIENSAKIANAAAGIVVGKLGTAPVTIEELKNALKNIKL